jgi:hypothetical protein
MACESKTKKRKFEEENPTEYCRKRLQFSEQAFEVNLDMSHLIII